MKKFVFLSLSTLSFYFLSAQPIWTWIQGDPYTAQYGIYGTKGLADSSSKPGTRAGEVSWKDATGNIYILGGNGYSGNNSGYLNDLWKYTPATDTWTWINGDITANQFGVYGTKGVPSPTNKIRSRAYATSWTDSSGNFWLYGGQGYDAALPSFVYIYLNDLWKFTPSSGMWTWMGGDTAYNVSSVYAGVYKTKGVATASNKPGSRINAASWADTSGNLWFFGGASFGTWNDLWKYTISTGLWTWMSGDTVANQAGRYGTKGAAAAANKPVSRTAASNWLDAAGNFWLFGGTGTSTSNGGAVTSGYLNDLWKYTPSSGLWTWMSGDSSFNQLGTYGTKGAASINSKPGARNGASKGMDTAGNLLLYGGYGNSAGSYNDIWSYSLLSNQWTWINGDTTIANRPAVYGQKGVASDTTKPGAGIFPTSWSGGAIFSLGGPNTIWRYSIVTSQWTWIRGDTASANLKATAVYGIQGVPAGTNTPGSRQYASSWTDMAGDFWLFGGYNAYTSGASNFGGELNDLWKYSSANKQWTWISGDSTAASWSYGSKGTAASTNKPRVRQQAINWKDNAGNFWMFGGVTGTNYFNDLWIYASSTGLWTWMGGDSTTTNAVGVYGTKGVAAAANKPGPRSRAASWTDASGDLWLFGGKNSSGYFDDLWKYTVSTGLWTWVSGDNTIYEPGYSGTYQLSKYGTKGVAAGTNKPGARYGTVSWADASGNLWMFGGTAYDNYVNRSLNDLWKYTLSTGLWTWISGDNTYSQQGIYGSQGVAATGSKPGARNGAFSWTDPSGDLLLFGGNVDSTNLTRYFNDIWKYCPFTGLWTWVSGDSTINQTGIYGTRGTASTGNKAGARNGVAGWVDRAGSVWIYGGNGYPVSGYRLLNDMLKFTASSTLPVLFSGFTARRQQQSALLSWSTAQEQHSRYFIIERSADGVFYSSIATVAASGNTSSASRYAYTDITPLQGNNFYRLKEVDLDNKFMYSDVQKIFMGEEAARFDIAGNPAQHNVQLNLQLPSAQKLKLQVTDAGGQLLISRSYTAGKGSTLLQLAVDQLAKGTYFISVQSESLHGTKAFIKQ